MTTSAVYLDASDSISRTTGPAYNAITIAAWVKPSSTIANFVATYFAFVRTTGYAYYGAFGAVWYGDDSALVRLTGGGFSNVDSSQDYEIFREEWLYVAFTSAGAVTDGFKGYVWTADGTLQKAISATPTGSGTIDSMYLLATDGGNNDTLGKVAYGRVWSRVLTQANLEAEMFSPTIVDDTNIYNAFTDDPSTDVSGQSHPWTVSGLTTDGSDTPPVSTGIPGFTFVWTVPPG